MSTLFDSVITGVNTGESLQYHQADRFPVVRPVSWLTAHFAVGGFSPLQRLSGMLTAHMSQIAPRNGFTWHPHRGLEIFTYVIDGELYHEDTTGGSGVIRAGEVQRMFSGDYIAHQELNRADQPARVIQIWFVPELMYRGLPPQYEQIPLESMPLRSSGDGRVREIIGPGGATDSHVDARLTNTNIPAGGRTTVERPKAGEDLFLYFVDGEGTWQRQNEHQSGAVGIYDVLLARSDAPDVTIEAGARPLNFLSFYLKPFISREGES